MSMQRASFESPGTGLAELRALWGRRRATTESTAPAVLPERVRIAIAEHQDHTEIVIGWLQLAVVLSFGLLYLVSPKVEGRVDLVPWALSIYLALTVIRLVWAIKLRLPAWSLVLSIVFDITLLMVLIWSFHLKYDQPASFYLKAPTLLYVFIFIALRALRFEARFVVLAGGLAILGWAVMILYVVVGTDGPMAVTRDYVVYLTSNSVLIGAEIDKIVSIAMVTGILAFSLTRGKQLLRTAVLEQTASRELSRFFAPAVAARIKESEDGIRAGSGELCDAAVLNLDMRGFTTFAAGHPPDVVMGLLADYQARVVPIIRAHRGSIDKFLGDGILATFGAAIRSETYAADSLRAMDDVMKAMSDWATTTTSTGDFRPKVNGAVASGRVLFGAVGDADRLEYTVIGEAVNLSAKLEKANKALQVDAVCDAATYDLALAQGYRPPQPRSRVPGTELAGVAGPVDVVVIAP